ncbi:glycoside hydrolase family 17 protein [Methylomonas sp. MgM2]
MMQTAKILFCVLCVVVAHGTIAWLSNRPQNVGPDVPAGKLRSLSFAPYYEGFSPITQTFPLPEHIDADLALLADKTYNVRTYSARGGMGPTPDYARKHGVDVMLGAWLGDGASENQLEIDALIKTANDHPDQVTRIIVGNEVMLRKDMDIDSLLGYIRKVKRTVKQPVSYADVWSSYMQYPQLFNEVDFITIHILPYWEDEPVSIDDAAEHVEKIVQRIEAKAREMGVVKPIVIGESGWPAIGRQRGRAVPSVVNEARFIRSLIQVANRHGFDYNIVEAFNQSWKSHHEGVVGANWGLFDINRDPVFPLTGPVSENPNWTLHFGYATALWLLVITAYFKSLRPISLPGLLVFLTVAQLFCVSLVYLAQFLWQTSYSDWQRTYAILLILMNSLLAALLIHRLHAISADEETPPWVMSGLRYGYLFFAVLAIYKTYCLAFDGRYLSFPTEQFTIPVIGILGLSACVWINRRRISPRHRYLECLIGQSRFTGFDRPIAYLMSFGIIALIAGETYGFLSAYDFIQAHPKLSEGLPIALGYTLQNFQLVTWLLCVLILSFPFWPKHGREPR